MSKILAEEKIKDMREIKFRGLRKGTTDEWLYGDLSNVNGDTYIFPLDALNSPDYYEVIRETVGQFTGLKDKNGVDVYEGDKLIQEPKSDWDKKNYTDYEVFFHDGDAHSDYNIGFTMCRTTYHGAVCGGYIPPFKPKQVSKMLVIGNIHNKK